MRMQKKSVPTEIYMRSLQIFLRFKTKVKKMTKKEFLHEVTTGNCPTLSGFTLYDKKKKAVLSNAITGETFEFKDAEEAYENAVLNGEKIKDIVERSEYEDLFPTTLDDSGIQLTDVTGGERGLF